MSKDMLGSAVQELVALPSETLGLACDLLGKLADPAWVRAAKRFLRKENPWRWGIIQAVPFNPAEFMDSDWTIDEQDERSLALTEVDLAQVKFETCLKLGETSITGKAKLKRLKKTGHIRLDARFFMALWKNQSLIPEIWKEKTNGNATYIYFEGTVLHNSEGLRRVLGLCWVRGQWCWFCGWHENDWNVTRPSAVLESSSLALEPAA